MAVGRKLVMDFEMTPEERLRLELVRLHAERGDEVVERLEAFVERRIRLILVHPERALREDATAPSPAQGATSSGAHAHLRDLRNGTPANRGRIGAYSGAAGEVFVGEPERPATSPEGSPKPPRDDEDPQPSGARSGE